MRAATQRFIVVLIHCAPADHLSARSAGGAKAPILIPTAALFLWGGGSRTVHIVAFVTQRALEHFESEPSSWSALKGGVIALNRSVRPSRHEGPNACWSQSATTRAPIESIDDPISTQVPFREHAGGAAAP